MPKPLAAQSTPLTGAGADRVSTQVLDRGDVCMAISLCALSTVGKIASHGYQEVCSYLHFVTDVGRMTLDGDSKRTLLDAKRFATDMYRQRFNTYHIQ